MILRRLFRANPRREMVETLYQRIAAASRAPFLYVDLGVPDTVEGRFEGLALHMILVLRRLRELPSPADQVAQDLVDCFFRHLDASLRELAVGDLAVPKRMKTLAEAFSGRSRAYDEALNGHGAGLAEALARNVLAKAEPALGLASYVRESQGELTIQDLNELLREGPRFAAPQPSSQGGRP